MKTLSILGSTGSIGTQTLDVVRQHPDLFSVKGLVAYRNVDILEAQIKEFQPEVAGLVDETAFLELKKRYQGPTKLVGGKDALIVAATLTSAELVVTAVVGAAGIEPTVELLKRRRPSDWPIKKPWWPVGRLLRRYAKNMVFNYYRLTVNTVRFSNAWKARLVKM